MTWDIEGDFTPNEEKLEEAEIKAKQLNAWFTQCFSSDSGKRVLEYLKTNTLDKPSFLPGQEVNIGIWREGQNNLVREILNRIEKGRNNE
jgi:hypothetical protein